MLLEKSIPRLFQSSFPTPSNSPDTTPRSWGSRRWNPHHVCWVSDEVLSSTLPTGPRFCSNPIMQPHGQLGRGSGCHTRTQKRSLAGYHPCNIIPQLPFLQEREAPDALCLFSQGCVERSKAQNREVQQGPERSLAVPHQCQSQRRGPAAPEDHPGIEIRTSCVHPPTASLQKLEISQKNKKSSGNCCLISDSTKAADKHSPLSCKLFEGLCHQKLFVNVEIPQL